MRLSRVFAVAATVSVLLPAHGLPVSLTGQNEVLSGPGSPPAPKPPPASYDTSSQKTGNPNCCNPKCRGTPQRGSLTQVCSNTPQEAQKPICVKCQDYLKTQREITTGYLCDDKKLCDECRARLDAIPETTTTHICSDKFGAHEVCDKCLDDLRNIPKPERHCPAEDCNARLKPSQKWKSRPILFSALRSSL